jgi:hypothetical protein
VSKFKIFVGLLVVLFVAVGGYFGYLSALVENDRQEFLQQIQEATDKVRLEKQLARAKSILDARSRAYIRRSQEFIRQKQLELSTQGIPTLPQQQLQAVNEINQTLSTLNSSQLPEDEQQVLQSLQEEQTDLSFFQDEVEVIEQVLAREVDQDEVNILLASDQPRRRISDALRQLLLLLDKQKELSQQRKTARDGYEYWQQNPKGTPDDIFISVNNKDGVARELNPLHVTQVSTALSIMPQGFDQRLKSLYVVYGDPKMRRGMSGVGVVFMKGEELDFFRVLVHEFGHTYDLHREVADGEKSQFYDGPYRLFVGDPSVEYYQYSWKSNSERSTGSDAFASTYGMSDPFEDFAEAFALYILQGETFASWKESDTVLARKYDYLNTAFRGRTFKSSKLFSTQPYDVTMLAVDYDYLLEIGG